MQSSLQPAPERTAWLPTLITGLGTLLLLAAGLLGMWPTLSPSLAGADPTAFWYVSRSTALVAYVLIWASMALGLAITNRVLRAWPGGPALNALHEHVSLLGLLFAVVHAAVLLGDHYIGYTPAQILVPMASEYRPLEVALGQIGLYALIVVTLSFYVRKLISYRWWRRLHWLSFGVFALSLVHGFTSGTDSSSPWLQGMYWASATSIVGPIALRIAIAASKQPLSQATQ